MEALQLTYGHWCVPYYVSQKPRQWNVYDADHREASSSDSYMHTSLCAVSPRVLWRHNSTLWCLQLAQDSWFKTRSVNLAVISFSTMSDLYCLMGTLCRLSLELPCLCACSGGNLNWHFSVMLSSSFIFIFIASQTKYSDTMGTSKATISLLQACLNRGNK